VFSLFYLLHLSFDFNIGQLGSPFDLGVDALILSPIGKPNFKVFRTFVDCEARDKGDRSPSWCA